MLGAGEVRVFGEPIALATKKALALLAYLALEGTVTRSRLATLLWSDNDDESARRNLRRELHRLRGTGLRDYLEVSDDTIGLNGVTSDVTVLHRLETSASEPEMQTALEGQALLLEGCELEGATGFAEWLERERGRVISSRRRLALSLAERLETRGEWRRALELHLRLLEDDTLQERQHREVMRLHYLLGEREAALEQFQRCRDVLHLELGLEPLPETRVLAERIRQALEIERVETLTSETGINLRSPLVGRDAQYASLEKSVGMSLLVGEPGIGKTRLAQELAVHRAGLTVRFAEASKQTPLSGVAEALRANLEHLALKTLETVWRSELARLVPEFEPGVIARAAPSDGRVRFLEGLTRALFALGTVIVLDDLHWADSASLELMAHLATRAKAENVLLIATARGQELHDNSQANDLVTALERDGHLQRLELQPLEQNDVLTLVRSMSGSTEGHLFARRLSNTTAGNPFFILETLRHLFEMGNLQVDSNGAWRTPFDETTSDYAELSVPPSVTRAILERVERLGAVGLRLLQTAALAGAEFQFSEIQPATALSEWEAVEGLERAVNACILERRQSQYRFAHDLVRTALETNLSLERRGLIHAKLAQSLQTQNGDPARIALHLESAGQPKQAVSWRIAAAENAERVFAYSDALEQLEQAVLDGDDPRVTFEIGLKKVNLLNNFVQNQELWKLELDKLEGIALSLNETTLKVDVALERIQYAIWYCQDSQVLEITGWILTQPELSAVQTAWALEYKGFALTSFGNLDESDAARLEAVQTLADMPSELCARVKYGLMMNAYKRGQYDLARDWAGRCREMCQTVGATAFLINVCTMEGVFAAIAGDLNAGIASLETARNEARRIGHSTYQFAALANLFELHFQRGDILKAQASLEEMALVRPVFFDPFEEAAFTRYQSQAFWFTGELGAALERALYAIKLDERSGAMEHRQLGRLVAAGLYLQLHDTNSAQPLLEEVRNLMTDSSLGFHRVDLELKTAQFEMLTGQPKLALERLEALDLQSAQVAEVTRHAMLKAKVLIQLEQPQSALEILNNASASHEPEDSANLISLQLSLEPESSIARASALEVLNSGRLTALTCLELQIAIHSQESSKAQLQKLHASLEGHVAAQLGLLERFTVN